MAPTGVGRFLGLVGWPLCGFIAITIVWSLFVDVFHSSASNISSKLNQEHTEIHSEPQWLSFEHIEDFFVFGDSFSTHWYDEMGTQPLDSNPLGNSGLLPNGTDDLGIKWIDFLALSYNQSIIRVTNMARDGALIEWQGYLPRLQGIAPDPAANAFRNQIDRYMLFYAHKNPWYHHTTPYGIWKVEKSMFVLWLGINDIIHAHFVDSRVPVEALAASYAASFERLYRDGARNFLMLNVPRIDLILGDKSGALRANIMLLNNMLLSLKTKLEKRHADIMLFYFDTFELYSQVVDDPTSFIQTTNLKNLTSFCPDYANNTQNGGELAHIPACGAARDEYFWHDDRHPTEVLHNVTAFAVARDCFGSERLGLCT